MLSFLCPSCQGRDGDVTPCTKDLGFSQGWKPLGNQRTTTTSQGNDAIEIGFAGHTSRLWKSRSLNDDPHCVFLRKTSLCTCIPRIEIQSDASTETSFESTLCTDGVTRGRWRKPLSKGQQRSRDLRDWSWCNKARHTYSSRRLELVLDYLPNLLLSDSNTRLNSREAKRQGFDGSLKLLNSREQVQDRVTAGAHASTPGGEQPQETQQRMEQGPD